MSKYDYGLPVMFGPLSDTSPRYGSGVMVKRVSKTQIRITTMQKFLNHSEESVVLTKSEAERLAKHLGMMWHPELLEVTDDD